LEFVRIGDKVISRQKIDDAIDQILALREKGLSQSDVAEKLGVDRTFVSRLETLGEIRKGGSMALIGFPLANPAEIERVAREEGVEFTLLMTDEERWSFVKEKSGIELLNTLMQIIAAVRRFEKVILIGSDKRLEIMRGLLDKKTEVASLVIGTSPISGDVYLNPESVREVIRKLKG